MIQFRVILITLIIFIEFAFASVLIENITDRCLDLENINNVKTSVTYVGNAGFLVNVGDKKILIDAIFKGFNSYKLPKEIQEKLAKGESPFDKIDLILVTHPHGDHFDIEMVKQHLRNNPKTVFASTKKTIELLNEISNKTISFDPKRGVSETTLINGINIEAFNLPHWKPKTDEKEFVNLGFLVSVNGIKFFHTGDIDFEYIGFDEIRKYNLQEKNIDIAFMQHFYLTDTAMEKKLLKEGICSRFIFPSHYHYTNPAFDKMLVRHNYPKAIFFDKELQSWEMPTKENDFINQTDAYFGQKPPKDSAMIFAPGIFSLPERLESNIVFSKDGKECYFGVLEIKNNKVFYKIYYTKYLNNKWLEQTETPFSVNNNICDPFLSADEKRLYFEKNGDIWMVKRTAEGWGEQERLPSPINSDSYDFSYMETTDSVVYISSKRPGGFGGADIWKIDKSLKAENLGDKFNTKLFDYSPFIAPDGSYFIFGSYRKGKHGQADLFISFRKENDEWTDPVNMNYAGAKINNNTAHHSNPSLSPDGKFLFFRRHETMMDMDVYWVSTAVISRLKEKVKIRSESKAKLFDAVKNGDLNTVKTILNDNPELLNSTDPYGNTPLIISCFVRQSFKRYPEIAKYLVNLGADVNMVNRQKLTALMKTCVGFAPDLELAKLLIKNGADVNFIGNNGITPLHYAALYRDKKLAEYLLENGAKINLYAENQEKLVGSTITGTVVQVSINFARGNENITKYLINNGADINKIDEDGNNEIHLALFKGNLELVRLLTESGVNVNHKNKFNKTPLYYAATHGFENIYNYLVKNGALENEQIKKNFGSSKVLTKNLIDGEAFIWDLGGYCHAVKTKGNFMIFSLGKNIDSTVTSGLAQGKLSTLELFDQNITFFLRNRDYYQHPAENIEPLKKLSKNTELISCYEPVYNSNKTKFKDLILAKPNEVFNHKGKKVFPIKALCGGMGYLVEVDGLRIFHAGMHISNNQKENLEAFKKEIDWLKKSGEIDLVFISVHSHSNKLRGSYEPYKYLLNTLQPKKVFLFGANFTQQYYNCYEALKKYKGEFIFPEFASSLGLQYYYNNK